MEQTCLEKYGVKNVLNSPEIQEKMFQSKIQKGVFNSISKGELELENFSKNLNIPIIFNDRKILNGKELDVYFPTKKIALEYNGLYWHSDSNKSGHNQLPTKENQIYAKNRHLEKTKLCEEKGIRLIHVFEDDWTFKKDIVKDIIKQALGLPEHKIFARKCEIRNIDLQTYKDFLNINHLQGYSFADVRIGLFYNNELIELIGINSKGTQSKKPELVRLCSKIGYQVLGGFSKLLKHSGFNSLVSYIDRGTFNGKGYQQSGFKIIKENPPTYFYTAKKNIREPRYKYMRKDIEKNLN